MNLAHLGAKPVFKWESAIIQGWQSGECRDLIAQREATGGFKYDLVGRLRSDVVVAMQLWPTRLMAVDIDNNLHTDTDSRCCVRGFCAAQACAKNRKARIGLVQVESVAAELGRECAAQISTGKPWAVVAEAFVLGSRDLVMQWVLPATLTTMHVGPPALEPISHVLNVFEYMHCRELGPCLQSRWNRSMVVDGVNTCREPPQGSEILPLARWRRLARCDTLATSPALRACFGQHDLLRVYGSPHATYFWGHSHESCSFTRSKPCRDFVHRLYHLDQECFRGRCNATAHLTADGSILQFESVPHEGFITAAGEKVPLGDRTWNKDENYTSRYHNDGFTSTSKVLGCVLAGNISARSAARCRAVHGSAAAIGVQQRTSWSTN